MRTAIIKTNFWLEDEIFGLNSDTRYLYLCILTNPQRDITPAFKCSDRLMSAYTGYNLNLIDICRKQLIEKGFIKYEDGYYILTLQNYVEPSKGRDTKIIYDRYFSELPENIKVLVLESTSTSTGTGTGTTTSVKDKDKDKDKIKNTMQVSEIIKLFETVDAKNKTYYSNKTQRSACDFLIENYGFDNVQKVIELLPSTNQEDYFPRITSPNDLKEKWVKLATALQSKKRKSAEEAIFI